MIGNTWAFTKKELRSYVNSPIAFIILTLFLLISGWFFTSGLFLQGQAEVRGVTGFIIPMIFLFFVPAITMRLVAEEKKTGTMELLVTLPVTEWEILLGKWLAAMCLLVGALILSTVYAITVSSLGDPDGGAIMGAYLGLLLMGGTYMAIGLFMSGLTENQIVGFITAFVVILALYLIDKMLVFFPAPVASVLEYVSIDYHYSNIARGVLDTKDLIYFGSMIWLFLFLSVRALESRRHQ